MVGRLLPTIGEAESLMLDKLIVVIGIVEVAAWGGLIWKEVDLFTSSDGRFSL